MMVVCVCECHPSLARPSHASTPDPRTRNRARCNATAGYGPNALYESPTMDSFSEEELDDLGSQEDLPTTRAAILPARSAWGGSAVAAEL